jgi:hypothetical protein
VPALQAPSPGPPDPRLCRHSPFRRSAAPGKFLPPRYDPIMLFTRTVGLVAAAGFLLIPLTGSPQSLGAGVPNTLSAADIVERMQRHDQMQAQELKHYQAIRHYKVEYHGFAASITARMDVEVTFDAATGKRFRILSQSGSKLLCDKVLKKAVDSEKEASQDKDATALTPANYKFKLIGNDSLDGRPSYILHVEPLIPSKFLYRGQIWVDATDFAVEKIEVEPAKNPSFWIMRPQIHFRSAKIGDFWLPHMNRSETKVRVGGTAVFTIDYGTYQIEPKSPDLTAHAVGSVHGGD